jgi:hypothetical protein
MRRLSQHKVKQLWKLRRNWSPYRTSHWSSRDQHSDCLRPVLRDLVRQRDAIIAEQRSSATTRFMAGNQSVGIVRDAIERFRFPSGMESRGRSFV